MNKTITLLIIGVIFLALLLMVFNSFKLEEQHGVSVSLTDKTRPQASAPPRVTEERPAPLSALSAPEAQIGTVLAPSAPKTVSQPTENAVAERIPSTEGVEGVAVTTVPAQIDAGHTVPVAPPSQTAAPAPPVLPPKDPVTSEPSVHQTSGAAQNITSIVVYATQEGATLRLSGDRPLVYTSMLLRDPDRLVLDFEGQWNVDIPGIPQNKLIKTIRVGRQADATRMVVDLHRAPASYRLIKASPQKLDVRLR